MSSPPLNRHNADAGALRPLASALRDLMREAIMPLRHWRSALRARRYARERGLKLHIGCGPNLKAGWVNIDAGPGVDLRLDLRRSLPFADGSCQMIYSDPGILQMPAWPGHPPWAQTWMERTNFLFRQSYRPDVDEHRMAYDFETLALNLQLAGFQRIGQRQFDAELASAGRRDGSLYVDAYRGD